PVIEGWTSWSGGEHAEVVAASAAASAASAATAAGPGGPATEAGSTPAPAAVGRAERIIAAPAVVGVDQSALAVDGDHVVAVLVVDRLDRVAGVRVEFEQRAHVPVAGGHEGAVPVL